LAKLVHAASERQPAEPLRDELRLQGSALGEQLRRQLRLALRSAVRELYRVSLFESEHHLPLDGLRRQRRTLVRQLGHADAGAAGGARGGPARGLPATIPEPPRAGGG